MDTMESDVNGLISVTGASRSLRRPIVPPLGPAPDPRHPRDSDFDDVLFWARLAASQSRKSPRRVQSESQALQTIGAKEGFLAEFLQWRTSQAFTAREKAAMELSECISKNATRARVDELLKNAGRHFNTAEMIQLTLSIQAINDWYDAHPRPEAYVLIVQDNLAERDHLREQARNNTVPCTPVFVRKSQEALNWLTGAAYQRFRASLIAMVVDVHLPDISAALLLQTIRTIPEVESLPVVVMTSSHHPRDIEECDRLKQETENANAVNVASFSEALVHIVEQSPDSTPDALPEPRLPEPPALSHVYERLRDHFQQKSPVG